MSSSCVLTSMLLLLLITTCSFFFHIGQVQASDPELLTDFVLPAGMNLTSINPSFFTFTGLRRPMGAPARGFRPSKVSVSEFPALFGLGVSMALLEFQADSINPLHIHPRATELLYVLDGTLDVGFIDSGNKLFSQRLQKGDVFVFPRGLVHYQLNPSKSEQAYAISAFSSASPGVVSTPTALFNSGIPSTVLEKTFQVSDDVVNQLEKSFIAHH